MVHNVTGADYITEQMLNATATKAKAEMTAALTEAAETAVDDVLDATIETKVDAAIALLPLPAVTVSDTVPATPVDGHIWIDTTGATEIFKLYTGTAWVTVTTTPIE